MARSILVLAWHLHSDDTIAFHNLADRDDSSFLATMAGDSAVPFAQEGVGTLGQTAASPRTLA
jgi:hypothetical protein